MIFKKLCKTFLITISTIILILPLSVIAAEGIVPILAAVVKKNEFVYQAKVLDIDNNGFEDIYITGGINRRVSDFIVKRFSDGSFTLAKTPTTSERSRAYTAKESQFVQVVREDFNLDGLLDFRIVGVGDELPGVPDLIVNTVLGNGRYVESVVPLDARYYDLADAIEQILLDTELLENITMIYRNQQQSCVTVTVPVYHYGVRVYKPITVCDEDGPSLLESVVGSDITRAVEVLATIDPTVLRNAFAAGSPEEYAEILSDNLPDRRQVIRDGRILVSVFRNIRRTALILSGILIADDATVVGVADDVAIPVLLTGAAVGVIVESILEAVLDIIEDNLENELSEDVVEESINVVAIYDFSRPPQCDLHRNTFSSSAAPSRILRDNLIASDCWCSDDSLNNVPRNSFGEIRGVWAHHIIPQGSNSTIAMDLRSCLSNIHGLDINGQHNGVCLPGSRNYQGGITSALPHQGDSGFLHGTEFLTPILDNCRTLDTEAFKDYLKRTGDNYTRGLPPPNS